MFGAHRSWRCWSRSDPATHYAVYEFADVGQAAALISSDKIKPDFDRVWGDRVARGREIPEIVQETTPQKNFGARDCGRQHDQRDLSEVPRLSDVVFHNLLLERGEILYGDDAIWLVIVQ